MQKHLKKLSFITTLKQQSGQLDLHYSK